MEEEDIMPEPLHSHALIALMAAILGSLITYIVAVVTLRDKIKAELSRKVADLLKKINAIYDHCETCRNECSGVRAMRDKDLNARLQQGDKQFTYIRLLLEDVICEKLEIPRDKIKRIRDISGVVVVPNRGST